MQLEIEDTDKLVSYGSDGGVYLEAFVLTSMSGHQVSKVRRNGEIHEDASVSESLLSRAVYFSDKVD